MGPQELLDCIEGALAMRRPWCLLMQVDRQQKPGLGTAQEQPRVTLRMKRTNEVSAKNEELSPRFLRPVWAEKALPGVRRL